jgi:hypothetical protein
MEYFQVGSLYQWIPFGNFAAKGNGFAVFSTKEEKIHKEPCGSIFADDAVFVTEISKNYNNHILKVLTSRGMVGYVYISEDYKKDWVKLENV